MEKISIIVRNFQTKDGRTFTKLSIGGKFINDVLADESVQYQVKFTANSQAKAPTEEGIYEVAFNDGEAWIDTREGYADKHLFRVVAQRIKFVKPLPKLEKDVRLVK